MTRPSSARQSTYLLDHEVADLSLVAKRKDKVARGTSTVADEEAPLGVCNVLEQVIHLVPGDGSVVPGSRGEGRAEE